MPLLDHFRPPLYPRRLWASFHGYWTIAIGTKLNQVVLPSEYVADVQIHIGGKIEVDVATMEDEPFASGRPQDIGGTATATAVLEPIVWAPPEPEHVLSTTFPDDVEIQVFSARDGRTLVAAIELISPGNKDRPETRTAFAAKCSAYLQRGIGLVIVDIVTERLANLHDELMDLLDQDVPRLAEKSALYAAAYRPARRKNGDQIDCWPLPMRLGAALPVTPLALKGGPTLPLDLEATYEDARKMCRL